MSGSPELTEGERERFRRLRTVDDKVIREFAALVLQSADSDSDSDDDSEVTKS